MKKQFYGHIPAWLWVVAIGVSLVTCKGAEGDVGPAGSPGPTGAAGPAGPVGPAGAANIIASAWTKVPDSTWKPAGDSIYFEVAREDAAITQPVLEKGLVMAYYRNVGRPSVVFSIPSVTEELALGFFMRMLNNKGSINFDMTFFKPRIRPIDFDLEFRWIIIPPNPGGRLKALDWTNYELVKQELGLLD